MEDCSVPDFQLTDIVNPGNVHTVYVLHWLVFLLFLQIPSEHAVI